MGGVVQSGVNPESAGFIEFAQNLLNKPDPNTVEFGGIALHDTVGDLNGFYLQFKDGALWWEGSTGGQPAGAVGAGTRMLWIPADGNFVAASAGGTQLDNLGFNNAIFGANNSVPGFANIVSGTDNIVTGNFSSVSGSGNTSPGDYDVISGTNNVGTKSTVFGQNFLSGQQNTAAGVSVSQNYINGFQIFVTNGMLRCIASGNRTIVDGSQHSLVIHNNPVPNPATTISTRFSSIIGSNISGTHFYSLLVGDTISQSGIGSQNNIIGGSITNQGSRNIISGNNITNNGSGNYLFGETINVLKSGVLFYQAETAMPSIYAELLTSLQDLGIGFGTTTVSEAYVNYKGGSTTKSVEHFEPASALKTTPVAGDLEADSSRLYYTVAPGIRETISFTSDNYSDAKITLSSADILSLNSNPIDFLPAPGVGFTYNIISCFGRYNVGTTAYAVNVNIQILFSGSNLALFTNNVLLTSTVNRIGRLGGMPITGTTTTQMLENTKIIVNVSGGNPTLGNGTLDLYITYKKVAL